jgi:hypothetical protein
MSSFKSLIFNFLIRNRHLFQGKLKKEVFDFQTSISGFREMCDELYEDGEKFAIKAKDAGVDVKFTPGPDMIHCYPLLAPMFREATEAMAEIVAFVRMRLKLIDLASS